MDEIIFAVWLTFKVFFIVLLIYFVVNGLDDLLIDAVYYLRKIYRFLFKRQYVRPIQLEQLLAVPQKPIAMLIPAWDESNVIRHMLTNTIATQRYQNYVIFVGTYPNDQATRLEVQKVREKYKNVEFVITPADGPTNKADCLNWVWQGILFYEKQHNVEFQIFVMHDAEDVIHPLEFLYLNYLIPRFHFVQIPVFPFPTSLWNFTNGVYMDEFAEFHTKDLRVREILSDALPSAGVGTALSREILQYLASIRKNQLFDVSSVTEDYLMGISLKDFPGRKIFLQQEVALPQEQKEPLATREFFPQSFRASTRQKSRWIMGISLQGWKAGWSNSFGTNYFLFRDRKAFIGNFVTVFGYLIVLAFIISELINRFSNWYYMPPLIELNSFFVYLIGIVFVLFIWRIFNRFYASYKIYGLAHASLVLPRLLYGNILNFCATLLALKRFLKAWRTGTTPAWGKTEHAYPTEEQLKSYHKKLGDILLEKKIYYF